MTAGSTGTQPSTTSDRLKAAAIELFARNGLDAVSVRDIAAAAGLKNAGSLNYYFRSKDELIRQIVVEVMGSADSHWKTGLDALVAKTPTPSLSDVVRVIVSWAVTPRTAERPSSTARFLAMFVQNRRELLRDLMLELGYVQFDRALAYLRARLDGIPKTVADQRLVFFFWSVLAFLAAREAAFETERSSHRVWSRSDVEDNFVDAMTGMLRAKMSASDRARRE
jgi:AcrR family transcriptional regulator